MYVERRLNDLKRDFQAGRHEASIVSSRSLESITQEDRDVWRTIRKELADIGISVAAFDANKTFIMDWFKTAIDNGAFEEQAPDDSLSSMGYDDADSQTTEDAAESNLKALEAQSPANSLGNMECNGIESQTAGAIVNNAVSASDEQATASNSSNMQHKLTDSQIKEGITSNGVSLCLL